ncbi:branched-chain amino acid transport system II carrier protein [Texcoconibacillus texcoconensis]|uniref:branched-chain amino acid transport system II carrier protein n=1 Tax=Texcoconibacillus texcoconensis TaxID=1095777 RepID=UPI001FE2B42D|nr:branched-chain amino acid transport system II carrier protein [Texcoconibacillus texcoconensis]
MEQKITKKETFFIGLMLFALFFGAGNLIFPPFLGQEAGTNYWTAIFGFVITGVGLPVLGIVAIALSGSSIESIAKKVSAPFAITFTFVLYLAIGPFFGIPRAMNVSYEMSVMPFIPSQALDISLFIYSVVFFIVVFWLSLNPSKLVKRIGNIITPILLIAIVLLVAGSALTGNITGGEAPSDAYSDHALIGGILEGYLTMDAIAALAFGLVIVSTLQARGIEDKNSILRTTAMSGIVAGIGLAFVYVSIGWLGMQLGPLETFATGSEILSFAANETYGLIGMLLLGVIVTLACLTTCVGLVTACGQYFKKNFPSMRYQTLALITTIVSFAVANLGLNTIISISVPVLVAIYPIAITLVFLTLTESLIPLRKSHYRGGVIGAALISIYDGMREMGIDIQLLNEIYSYLPLFEVGLGWIWLAIIGVILGFLIGKVSPDK